MTNNNHSLRIITRGAYDLQKLRIMMGNRIVAQFKATEIGQKPGMSEEELDPPAKELLAALRESYKKLTDGVKTFPRHGTFKGDELIDSYTALVLVSEYFDIEDAENKAFAKLKNILKDFPVYNNFLLGVKGVGPAMAAIIISEIDIHKCRYASSVWKYAGMDVAPDGDGRSRRKAHLIDVTYVDKEGDTCLRKSITFNPGLKTKLVGVLGPSFLKAGNNKYSRVYYDYKNRIENHPKHKDKKPGHRHNMSIRYMVKRFLVDLYVEWRAIEGLEVMSEYSEGKLGMVHGN